MVGWWVLWHVKSFWVLIFRSEINKYVFQLYIVQNVTSKIFYTGKQFIFWTINLTHIWDQRGATTSSSSWPGSNRNEKVISYLWKLMTRNLTTWYNLITHRELFFGLPFSLSLSLYIYIYIYTYIGNCNWIIGLVGRVFANGPVDRGSIAGHVISKTLKNDTWYLLA